MRQRGEESLCSFIVEDVASVLGKRALGLAADSSSYELAQGLAAEGCGGLLEVALLLGDPDLDPQVLAVGLEVISRAYGVRPDRSRCRVPRETALGTRLVWMTAKWPQNRVIWLRKADLNLSPRFSLELRTAVNRREIPRKHWVSWTAALACSRLFTARGTAEGPQRDFRGPSGLAPRLEPGPRPC